MRSVVYDKSISWRLRRIANKNLIMNNLDAFELNELGLAVWNLIDGSKSLDDIIKNLIMDYDVNEEQLAKDIGEFCTDLEESNALIRSNIPA